MESESNQKAVANFCISWIAHQKDKSKALRMKIMALIEEIEQIGKDNEQQHDEIIELSKNIPTINEKDEPSSKNSKKLKRIKARASFIEDDLSSFITSKQGSKLKKTIQNIHDIHGFKDVPVNFKIVGCHGVKNLAVGCPECQKQFFVPMHFLTKPSNYKFQVYLSHLKKIHNWTIKA